MGAVATTSMLALLAIGFRKPFAVIYFVIIFLDMCYNEKKNMMVVFACLVVVLMKHLKQDCFKFVINNKHSIFYV
jgi:hypothetical protein